MQSALAIYVNRSPNGQHLVLNIDRLTSAQQRPALIRMDTRPEMTCHEIVDPCRFNANESAFIHAGAPLPNALMQSFNGEFRNDLPAMEVFRGLLQDKIMAANYQNHCNTHRPHSSIGYRRPDVLLPDWSDHHPSLSNTQESLPRCT